MISVKNVWTHYRVSLVGPRSSLFLTLFLYVCIYICACKHIHIYFCFSSITLLEGSSSWSVFNVYCCADASAQMKSWFSRKLFNCINQGCRNCGWWKDSNVTFSSQWEILSGSPLSSSVLLCVCTLGRKKKTFSDFLSPNANGKTPSLIQNSWSTYGLILKNFQQLSIQKQA